MNGQRIRTTRQSGFKVISVMMNCSYYEYGLLEHMPSFVYVQMYTRRFESINP